MGCNSDYMAANSKEIALSQVACLLDELKGKKINPSHWSGYHPKVYNQHVDGDDLVAELCSKLQSIDVSQKSLEMQIWWRDHQAADKKRLQAELKKAKDEKDRQAAIAKLSKHERDLLGL